MADFLNPQKLEQIGGAYPQLLDELDANTASLGCDTTSAVALLNNAYPLFGQADVESDFAYEETRHANYDPSYMFQHFELDYVTLSKETEINLIPDGIKTTAIGLGFNYLDSLNLVVLSFVEGANPFGIGHELSLPTIYRQIHIPVYLPHEVNIKDDYAI